MPPGTSPWFDAVLSVFIGTNLVTSGVGEHELVIRGEAGMYSTGYIFLSVPIMISDHISGGLNSS